MYLGDLLHTSFSPGETAINSTNVAHLQQLWKVSVGAPVASGITVTSGQLYFGAWDGNFYALDAATGNVIWKQFVGLSAIPEDADECRSALGVSSQAAVAGGVVYVGGGDSAVYALDRQTGSIRWRVPLADPATGAYIWSSIMYSGGSLYLGVASLGDCPLVRGAVAKIDTADPAHPRLQYLVPEDQLGAGVWSTPAVDAAAGRVYVTTGNGGQNAADGAWGSALLALDPDTLAVRSSFFMPVPPADPDADWGTSPTLFQLSDGTPAVVATGKTGMMFALSRPQLAPLWSLKVAVDCVAPEQGCGSISTPAFDGKVLFSGAGQNQAAGSSFGTIYAIDPNTGNVIWHQYSDGVVLAPVTVTPGLVYVPTTLGLEVLDAASGARLWDDQQHGTCYGQAAVSGGRVYSAYTNGDVIAWGILDPGWTQTRLLPDSDRVSFAYTQGGTPPTPQSLRLYASTGALSFSVTSESSWLSTSMASGTTPANIDIQVDTTGMDPGQYQGALTINSGQAVNSSVNILVTVAINGPLPALSAGNITNGASFAAGPLAPGVLFSIFGDNLAGPTLYAPGLPWPTQLGGVSVTVNGTPVPLQYVSPSQINGQLPYGLAPGSVSLVLKSGGAVTDPVQVAIAAASPGILTDPDTGQAIAQNPDFTLNSPDSPASAGSVLAVYWTGQGEVDCTIPAGAPAPMSDVCTASTAASATVGGQPAPVLFSGLAPGMVGLAQANVQIPDLPPGDYPLVLSVAGQASNAATVSIRN